MKVGFQKRFFAYLIDFLLLSFVLYFINTIFHFHVDITSYELQMETLTDQVLNGVIPFSTYTSSYSKILYQMDYAGLNSMIAEVILLLSYFVILPYFWKGKTVGKHIMHIRVQNQNEEKKLSIWALLIRSLIITGVFYSIIDILLLVFHIDTQYLIWIGIFGFIEFALVMACVFMVLCKKDKLGLHDILAHTVVTEEVK